MPSHLYTSLSSTPSYLLPPFYFLLSFTLFKIRSLEIFFLLFLCISFSFFFFFLYYYIREYIKLIYFISVFS